MTKEGAGVTKTVIAGPDLITSLPAPTGNLLCRQHKMPDHVGHDKGHVGHDKVGAGHDEGGFGHDKDGEDSGRCIG